MQRNPEKRNIRKYYLRYSLYYFANTFVTGGMIQAFMLESGISGSNVSVYMAVIQIVQAAAMLLLGPVLEKRRDIIKLNADASFLQLPLCVCVLVICFFPGISTGLKYGLLMLSSIIAYIALAVIGILEYKLPYVIINMENYGRVILIAGFCIGFTSMASSSLFSLFIKRYDFFITEAAFISVGIVLMIISIFVGRSYKPLAQYEKAAEERKTEGTGESIFHYGPFRKLLIPNILRGFASGTFALLTTVGYYYGIIDSAGAALMVVISNIVVMGGCILYAAISKKKIDGMLTVVSSVMLCILMPAMLIGKNRTVFIILYAAGVFFRNIIDYSCPVICAGIVDFEHAGEFSSWRIALYMLGAAVAGFLTVPMLERLGGIPTMLINGIIFIIMGTAYWSVSRKNSIISQK